MKPRLMLPVILAIVAAIEILASVALDALGLAAGIGRTALGAALFAAASAVPLYLLAVHPSARNREDRDHLARRADVQDTLIGINATAIEETDPGQVLQRAAEDLRRLLGAPRCTFWLFGDPDAVVEHVAVGLRPAMAEFPLRESARDRVAACRPGNRTVVDDVRKSAAYRSVADDMERFGARSFIEAPLHCGGSPIGFLLVCRPEPRPWSEEEVLVTEAVARHAARAVVHAREFRDHEEMRGSLLSLLDHIPGLVYRGQRDWSMSIISAEIERMVGYSPREFHAGTVNWKDLIHPDDLPAVKTAFRSAVLAGQKVLRVEYRARHRNGSYRWFADRRQMIYDDAGRFLYADGLCLDITERKRAETEKAAPAAAAGVRAGA